MNSAARQRFGEQSSPYAAAVSNQRQREAAWWQPRGAVAAGAVRQPAALASLAQVEHQYAGAAQLQTAARSVLSFPPEWRPPPQWRRHVVFPSDKIACRLEIEDAQSRQRPGATMPDTHASSPAPTPRRGFEYRTRRKCHQMPRYVDKKKNARVRGAQR